MQFNRLSEINLFHGTQCFSLGVEEEPKPQVSATFVHMYVCSWVFPLCFGFGCHISDNSFTLT